MPEYIISLSWDSEAAVWIATSGDIPGLILESGSLDALIERVRFAVPELLELNGITQETLSMCFRSERREEVRL
ncbi:antitoxin HicB [Synergistales bacterium]|nr:antitoxin HicB [Synergistales bacterium]